MRERFFSRGVSVIQEVNMSRIKLFPLLFSFTFSLFVSHFDGRTALAQAKNDNAPSFTLKLLNGGDLKSSDLKGKVTVLKFVASY